MGAKNYFIYLIIILLVAGIAISSKTNVCSKSDLESTIMKVVKGFKEKNAQSLNNLIAKDKGVVVIFRRGVLDRYTKTNVLDFNKPLPEYLPYPNFSIEYKLKFESLPNFDCKLMYWNKLGLFCDTTTTDNLLSDVAKELKKSGEEEIADSEVKGFIELEKKSKRIILADKDGGGIIFYLTLIKNKWYLTIIDRITTDCGV